MVKTIGNPLTWTARGLAGAAGHVTEAVEQIGGDEAATPTILPMTLQDIRDALRLGYADFAAVRADVMFICLIYPAIGILLVGLGLNAELMHILFPVAAGFALIGPFAAVGLYEVSRRRENGEEVSWLAAIGVVRSPKFAAILVLGLYLAALFVAWIVVAHTIWLATLGPEPQATLSEFLLAVLTTDAGWAMTGAGLVAGFCFALTALATSAISFPLLLDHNIGVPAAVVASWQVFRENPLVMSTWGLVVAALLVLGSIPLFLGLIVVLPVLGHATWHLYRRAIRIG